jgi:SagB-type dehydrogenase family enzyme
MTVAQEYLDAILNRGRAGMEPIGFEPDWADRPRKEKTYHDAESFPLPPGDGLGLGPLDDGLFGPGPGRAAAGAPQGKPFTLATLGGLLLDSYGQLTRRLAVHANADVPAMPRYTSANWSRGTSSGGGLYPVSIYWVSGPNGPLTPGIYHYSPPHHAMRRLLTGDVTGEVRAAVGDPALLGGTDQFLVLGIKFWQNAFKYNSFSYHAVTMDIGTLIQTWRMWARAQGLRVKPVLWFDELRLGRLLGVATADEGVFAVAPLAWRGDPAAAPRREVSGGHGGQPRVRYTEAERSRTVLTFPTLRDMHAATIVGPAVRPPALEGSATVTPRVTGQVVALPPRQPMTIGIRDALRARRSSFGRFSSRTSMDTGQLSTVLAAAMSGAAFPCDVHDEHAPALAKIYVFASHVDGVEPGGYEYDAASNELRVVKRGPPGEFLQRNYFLANYNVEQAGAVIVVTTPSAAVLRAAGDRGYRLANATIGAVAQAVYTACAALGLGCGAALGFDNVSYIEELALAGTGQAPLLIIMVGAEGRPCASFRYEIA